MTSNSTRPPAKERPRRELPFSLPPLFLSETGERIRTAEEWKEKRRLELLELFRTHVYGRTPVEKPADLHFKVDATIPDLFSGKAVRKEVSIGFSGPGGEGRIRVFLTLPTGCTQPTPAFCLICHLPPELIDLRKNTPFGRWKRLLNGATRPSPSTLRMLIRIWTTVFPTVSTAFSPGRGNPFSRCLGNHCRLGVGRPAGHGLFGERVGC